MVVTFATAPAQQGFVFTWSTNGGRIAAPRHGIKALMIDTHVDWTAAFVTTGQSFKATEEPVGESSRLASVWTVSDHAVAKDRAAKHIGCEYAEARIVPAIAFTSIAPRQRSHASGSPNICWAMSILLSRYIAYNGLVASLGNGQ
ncbi:hypothetical protein H257_12471 [Aphanomyces astaci]|uniref:Uncharacterized protein n=1 Tax=Aphanomyces astaci TaxID=112090 RepID=W4G033_APHAT|nr:hypothetical protein H257_12471 [Aphanomyces astaci]ETV72303.1 hypothetical protein H257_12471 [Aphanomyces astaci]|eukprot:XP_009837985.1 hypothetical protein H257_12471 [Aphanomyces astaci]